MDSSISVLLVDDHELARRGTSAMLSDNGISVTATAGSVEEALSLIETTPTDVALLDLNLPDGSGVELCAEITSHHPEVKCVMFSASDDPGDVSRAAAAGAAGYVVKNVIGTALIACIRTVALGRYPIRSQLAALRPVSTRNDREDPRIASLSPRETEVLELIARGLTNREISERTQLAEKTIKNYVSGLLAKLDLSRRTQAAILYLASTPSADHGSGGSGN